MPPDVKYKSVHYVSVWPMIHTDLESGHEFADTCV